MPIRLNLLAEAQALEEQRRRDPVKRSIFVGVGLVALMLVWSLSLWLESMSYKSEIASSQNHVKSDSATNKVVLSNQKQVKELSQKLDSLQKFSRERFLVANLMDALQRVRVPDVQVTRLQFEDQLSYNEEVKADPEIKRVGKPASGTDKIVVTLYAKDASAKPGDLIPKFQQAVADAPYFSALFGKSDNRVRLKPGTYTGTQVGPDGQPYQPFALECFFPEKTR